MAETETESVTPIRPIIVIRRKKGGHGGHHGGAWKVAYADFVTAMMALFIVLWLMGSDKDIKEEISAYFNNPSGPGKLTGTAAAGQGNALELPKEDMKKLLQKIQQALLQVPDFKNLKDHVEITITSDGLRIELLESEAGMFFESGKPTPSATGKTLLETLAVELGKLPNNILIEGHTDSKGFSRDDGYSNWELSADRANSARRLMQASGLRPEQIAQVRGFADRQLRHPEDPSAASNRRISVIVQYVTPPEPAAAEGAPSEKEGEKKPTDEKKAEGEKKADEHGKPEAKPEPKSEKPAEAPKATPTVKGKPGK